MNRLLLTLTVVATLAACGGTSDDSLRTSAAAHVSVSSTDPFTGSMHSATVECSGDHTGFLGSDEAQIAACSALLGNDIALDLLVHNERTEPAGVDCGEPASGDLLGAEYRIRGRAGSDPIDTYEKVETACDEYLWLALHPLLVPVDHLLLISSNEPFDACRWASELSLRTALCRDGPAMEG